MELSRRMDVADGTLGRIKYASGNPQLANLVQIACFFKLRPWQLLVKDGYKLPRDFDPSKQPVPKIEDGHVRISRFNARPSAILGSESESFSMVLGHIDVAEAWARKHLGVQLDSVRAVTVAGDGMSPTINEGDLAFIDADCRRFETDGIYVVLFNEAVMTKRLSADFATRKIHVRSDNDKHDPQLVAQNELTICGRVLAWLTLREH
ncbi:putative phage repressor (plasmid) [Polaromonas naphthalenivorans CJ2]|uniref:Putative phage repressor n=2 Tax=Polaromonas naphthalenivorans TaxID=216465 RepID=A1VX46_POLNA|nr:putative phage repressor [Polaromonas naphthalenivorans CJ2]